MTSGLEESRGRSWKFRAVLAGIVLVPREWARFIGNRVEGRLWAGTTYGLLLGFVCTLLPQVVLRQAFRSVAWKLRGAILVLAAVAALPNLMTLGIVWGNGNAAHAGERILDVDGPGFRWATAFGVLGAAAVFVVLLGLRFWTRDRGPSRELRAAREAAGRD